MADPFDINDRTTWDWNAVTCGERTGVGEFLLHRRNPEAFYQCSNGIPIEQPCPGGMVFNPMANVCDWPRDVSEADIYDWAVANGAVNEQR